MKAREMDITTDVAKKLLYVVDHGLVEGLGTRSPGRMCVEAAVSYALGLPHGDRPPCVAPVLRQLKIELNDRRWSTKMARARGLRRLALAQLGSAGALDELAFAVRVVEGVTRTQVPLALRIAAKLHPNPERHADLKIAALRCEEEGTRVAAANAANAASLAASQTNGYADCYTACTAALFAANSAADAFYEVPANAVAVHAATSAVGAAAAAAAAAHSGMRAADKARDEVLADFAENVVQILVQMDAPGCQWLTLTEEVAAQ